MAVNRANENAASQVDLVFTLDAVYVIYVAPGTPLGLDRKIKAIYQKYARMHKNFFQNPVILKIFDETAQLGIHVIRYSTTTGDPSRNILDNWPLSIPIYIDPKEPLTTKLGRIKGSRAVDF